MLSFGPSSLNMIKEFSEASTILVDKPLEWTSFDVVNKIRWYLRKKLGVKKLKVGHAGTLDPLATGLLVICIGKHTKTIESLMAVEKEYTGKILLGKTTPSYDLETKYDQDYPTEHINSIVIESIRKSFLGDQMQLPPIFSAKQVDGKRAYDLARAGKEVKLELRPIHISLLEIDDTDFPILSFRVRCSKGTYIRSLAHDIGKALNSGATLIELRREASGDHHVKDAKSVEDWIDFIQSNPL